MIWFFIILILIIFIFLIRNSSNKSVPKKKLNYFELQLIKKEKTLQLIEEINNLPSINAIYYLEKLEQNTIDDLYNFKNDNFKDWLVERAFRKRYRWEKIDTDFWIQKITTRDYNKQHNIKKPIKKRTKKEIFQDSFPDIHDDFYEKITGFIYVHDFEIKGIHISDRFDYLSENSEIGDNLVLEEDYNNRYDENAVKVKLNKKVVGFVSRDDNKLVRTILKHGYICKLCDLDYDEGYTSAYFSLYVKNIYDE